MKETKDALMVASVSLVTPVFLLFMAIGTVFGIGGTSVISRAMGEGRRDYAKKSMCVLYVGECSRCGDCNCDLKNFSVKDNILKGVLAIGIPAALGEFLLLLVLFSFLRLINKVRKISLASGPTKISCSGNAMIKFLQ